MLAKLKDEEIFDGITKEEGNNFCNWCESVFTSPFFSIMIKHLYYDQMVETTLGSKEDHDFNKAKAEGIKIVENEFRKYSNKVNNQPKEDFDNSKMIGRL